MSNFRPFQLERYFAAHEHAVPHLLGASDCEPLRLGDLLHTCGVDPAALLSLRLGYGETRGSAPLRRAIAVLHPDCTHDDVLVAGAPQEAILLTMQAALSPGERVVVLTPCYQSLQEVPRQLGCQVVPWPLRDDGDAFAIDLPALDRLLQQKTRMVVTNFPHNPTGVQPTADQWRELQSRIERSGALWFSDEIYRGLAPQGRELPPVAGSSPRAISFGGLSKSFGLAGLRLGWLCARNRGLLAAIEARKDYTSICSNPVAEFAAVHALQHAPVLWQANRERIAQNQERMQAFAASNAETLRWRPPQAGPVSLARLHKGGGTAMAERARALGAMLVPGTLFDLDDAFLRIGLGRADFAAALDCWQRALAGAT